MLVLLHQAQDSVPEHQGTSAKSELKDDFTAAVEAIKDDRVKREMFYVTNDSHIQLPDLR